VRRQRDSAQGPSGGQSESMPRSTAAEAAGAAPSGSCHARLAGVPQRQTPNPWWRHRAAASRSLTTNRSPSSAGDSSALAVQHRRSQTQPD